MPASTQLQNKIIASAGNRDAFATDTILFEQRTDKKSERAVAGKNTDREVLPPHTKLAHFTIEKYIGGGGMGRVYLATDTALARKVAIKTLPRQQNENQTLIARFMNEAQSAARLNHEHIAQVYFAGESEVTIEETNTKYSLPYIAFEYVEGKNVKQLAEETGGMPLPQALNYIVQVAHALAHAAEHGVVHRDVKPSNILVAEDGKAKLIDMGLARLLVPVKGKSDLTVSGVTLGTFDYISPEQALDPRNADTRSDIYSLGCTFFFMIAGCPPFPEGTVLQKLLQHQGNTAPDIRSFRPNTPAVFAEIIKKMMEKAPAQRYQTPQSLIEALLSAAQSIGLQTTGRGTIVWQNPARSRQRQLSFHYPWMIAVSIFLAGFLMMTLLGESPLSLPQLPEAYKEPDNQKSPSHLSGETLPVTAAAVQPLLESVPLPDLPGKTVVPAAPFKIFGGTLSLPVEGHLSLSVTGQLTSEFSPVSGQFPQQ